MEITAKTTIEALLTAHPFMVEELPKISHHFEKLKNPFLRKTFGKIATVSTAAEVAGLKPEELVAKLNSLVAAHQGGAEARQETLKGLIRELHAGSTVEEVKERFKELVGGVDATEIAKMEQALLNEGLPAEEIQRLCDVHVAVFKDALEAREAVDAPPGHPINTYMLENRATEDLLSRLNLAVGRLGHPPSPGGLSAEGPLLKEILAELSKIRLHYERKENQLFPALEAHHFSAPSQVMWSIHDQIRADLKKAAELLEAGKAKETSLTLRALSQAIRDMIYKEEHILFPAAFDMLSEDEWKMAEGEAAIGFAWVTPGGELPKAKAEEPKQEGNPLAGLRLDTGSLSGEQINMMLKHLPVDLTFVDENDRVAYYSEGPHRIFPRSPGIIGREVRNCHPPKSVHVVNNILDAFKAGEKSEASFWIEMGGQFILIRYYAMRDAAGTYRGCLEVSQEVSGIRALTGQRRLLEWE